MDTAPAASGAPVFLSQHQLAEVLQRQAATQLTSNGEGALNRGGHDR